MNALKRIKEYIDFKGISNKAFEISVGFSNGAFASQLKNNKTIGVDKLENILKTYKELNPNWVLLGEGEMLKISKNDSSNSNQSIEDIIASKVESRIKSILPNRDDLNKKMDKLMAMVSEVILDVDDIKEDLSTRKRLIDG